MPCSTLSILIKKHNPAARIRKHRQTDCWPTNWQRQADWNLCWNILVMLCSWFIFCYEDSPSCVCFWRKIIPILLKADIDQGWPASKERYHVVALYSIVAPWHFQLSGYSYSKRKPTSRPYHTCFLLRVISYACNTTCLAPGLARRSSFGRFTYPSITSRCK